jgi:TolB-like protein
MIAGQRAQVAAGIAARGAAPRAIAMLPFQGLGDAPVLALAEGLAGDLAVELAARAGLGLHLPAPAGRPDGLAIAAALELRGSLRCDASGEARITLLLLCAETRGVRWGARFDARLARGLFLDAHDALVSRIADAVARAARPATQAASGPLSRGAASPTG